MKFLVENIDDRYNELIEILDRKGLDYKEIKYIPFKNTFDLIIPKEERKDYFPLASVNTTLFAENLGMKVMTNDIWDYDAQWAKFGSDFINEHLDDIHFGHLLKLENFPRFVRDRDAFNIVKGKVLHDKKDAEEMYHKYFHRRLGNKQITYSSPLVKSDAKHIINEYRFFVVNGVIVTGSMYMENGSHWIANIDNTSIHENLWNFAYKMVGKYATYGTFVLDVAKMDDWQLKVVEVNCLNCSGFYAINLDKLIEYLVYNFH